MPLLSRYAHVRLHLHHFCHHLSNCHSSCSNTDIPGSQKANDVSSLKDQIIASSDKRLYIKVSGQVTSKVPLKVLSGAGESQSAVLTCDEVTYLQGLGANNSPNVQCISTADEVTMDIGIPANAAAPKLIVDPRCLELIQRVQVGVDEKEIGSRLLSLVLGITGVSYPYRCVTNHMIVPANRHAFGALDAVVDINGNITLIKPNSFSRRAVLSSDAEQTIKDNLLFNAKLCGYSSVATATLGIMLAASGFLSGSKK